MPHFDGDVNRARLGCLHRLMATTD
jgi:hypothetical protein